MCAMELSFYPKKNCFEVFSHLIFMFVKGHVTSWWGELNAGVYLNRNTILAECT